MKRTILILSHLVVALTVALVMVACGGTNETAGPNTAQALSYRVVEGAKPRHDVDKDSFSIIEINGVPCIYMTVDLECDFTDEHFAYWVGD